MINNIKENTAVTIKVSKDNNKWMTEYAGMEIQNYVDKIIDTKDDIQLNVSSNYYNLSISDKLELLTLTNQWTTKQLLTLNNILNKHNKTNQTQSFLTEITQLCEKYNLSIAHEDSQGAFIIENFKEENIKWINDAITKNK